MAMEGSAGCAPPVTTSLKNTSRRLSSMVTANYLSAFPTKLSIADFIVYLLLDSRSLISINITFKFAFVSNLIIKYSFSNNEYIHNKRNQIIILLLLSNSFVKIITFLIS